MHDATPLRCVTLPPPCHARAEPEAPAQRATPHNASPRDGIPSAAPVRRRSTREAPSTPAMRGTGPATRMRGAL